MHLLNNLVTWPPRKEGLMAEETIPLTQEGFDELHYVRMGQQKEFIVERWQDEV